MFAAPILARATTIARNARELTAQQRVEIARSMIILACGGALIMAASPAPYVERSGSVSSNALVDLLGGFKGSSTGCALTSKGSPDNLLAPTTSHNIPSI